ncbi:putative ribonuclease H-like domain-containing protein, partial [Tanacetum coccineum]
MQYFQLRRLALWDVIENGNSFKPAAQTTTNVDGTSTSLIPGPVTTEEKTQKKNDVKARNIGVNTNGSQLVYEDLEQIHEDDIEEIDLKWQLALLSMRTRRLNANYHQRERVVSSNNYTREFDEGYVTFGGGAKGGKITGNNDLSKILQNGVAERRNRTLIEAARTMLADSKLPTTFWAEAVNTACYVHNRVLVVKPHNKTLYELFRGRTPALSFMRPFGYHVTILNTLNYLGKFDGKSDEGFFVGYSLNSKAFRVYNIRTSKVEESLHIRFLEDKPIIAGTNSNDSVGTEESVGIGHSSKKTGSSQNYILMTLWKDGSLFDSSSKNASNNEPQPSSDAGKKDDEGCGVQTRRMTKTSNEKGFISAVYERKTHKDLYTCLFACFLSQVEPKNKVWTLVDLPYDKRAIGTKWVYKNKKDERVARIEAIRLFLAYASFKDFVVYQMDVKSVFLYGKIKEEVYVCQPLGFEDPEFPGRVYKRGQIDKTLFIKRVKGDILLVQVYVDDIIFKFTRNEMCTEFEKMMHKKFQMSFIGELTFFLGLQVTQKDDGIFISQDKYVDEILKKFGFSTVKIESTPIETLKPLLKDAEAKDVDVHLYRSMIGSLMYLTTLRPDIMFVVCACARFQVTPKVSHLQAVKRIFRYLKGQPKLGLWYPKDSPFDLEAYTNSDYAGASLDKKSTTGAEYVAAASCCGKLRIQCFTQRLSILRLDTTSSEIQMEEAYSDNQDSHRSESEYAQMMLETTADDAIQVSVVGLTYYG